MCEGAKDSVQVMVLCCALYSSGSLQWGCIRIVHSYSMVMHIELSFQVHIGEGARRSNGESVQVIVLCCTLFGSRSLNWCAYWIVNSYCMVVHIGLFS